MKRKNNTKKLSLSRETVAVLNSGLQKVQGGFLSITYCGNKCGQKRTVDPNMCKTVNWSCPEQSCGCDTIVLGG